MRFQKTNHLYPGTFFRKKNILTSRTKNLNLILFTFTLETFKLLLKSKGKRFYFSQSTLGQCPKTPLRNFSLILASPLGYFIYLA